ncbi:MAG TPA: hypothetical protein VD962_09390, partial [Rubricoccaceae bacterium]|nr:hypothetical protein [Rubricoccaceae bacterium]
MNEYGSPLLRAALCALLGTLVAAPLHAQPSISVSPDSLSASLMTGQTETQPLTISNGGTSSLTFAITFPDVGTDSLAYDDGNNTADGFWGWGGGGPGGPEYTCASRFTPTGPFTLTAVRAVVNTFNHLSSVTVEVYGAGTPGIPTSGPLLRTVTVPIQAPYPGRMLDLPLGTSLPFDPGEEFYVVLRFDNELAVPMGGDYLTTERSYVLRWHTNRWEEQQGVTWVLRAVGGSGAWLSADPLTGTVPAGQSLAVDVTFDAMTLLDGTYQQDLVVSSNDPDDPVVVVPATLVVSGEPDIALSADSLDHGTVFVGAFSERTYEITNIGTDTLVVSTITSSDPAFVPDPAGPFSLE